MDGQPSIVPNVSFQLFQRHDFQGLGMRAFQDNMGRDIGVISFFPAQGAEAPAISRLEAGKIIFRSGRDEIIPARQRELQKFIRDPGTNHVGAKVMVIGVTAAVPKKSGERVERTGCQGGAENIQGFSGRHLRIGIFVVAAE